MKMGERVTASNRQMAAAVMHENESVSEAEGTGRIRSSF